MTNTDEQSTEIKDFSSGVQRKTTKFLKKDNEVLLSTNARYARLGGIEKIYGYTQLGNTITSSSTSSSTTSTSTSTSSSTSTSTSTSSTTTG